MKHSFFFKKRLGVGDFFLGGWGGGGGFQLELNSGVAALRLYDLPLELRPWPLHEP